MALQSIHITEIEAAINYWRALKPSPDGVTLAPELRALAEVYALMIFHRQDEAAEKGFPAKAYAAWRAWYDTTPARPAKATLYAKAVGVLLKKCSTGLKCRRAPSGRCGGELPCRDLHGGSTGIQSARLKASLQHLPVSNHTYTRMKPVPSENFNRHAVELRG
jgi:hypothetical protein